MRGVRDERVAWMMARDLMDFLARRAATIDGPVFGIALFVDDQQGGGVGVGIGTERWYDRFCLYPVHRDLSEEIVLSGPAYRWWSGNWDLVAEQFLTDRTARAIEPACRTLADPATSAPKRADAARRMREYGFSAAAQVVVPATLATAVDTLVYAETPDVTCAQLAEGMLRTIPAARLHAAVPHWRRLAQAVHAVRTDATALQRLRQLANGLATGRIAFPRFNEDPLDDLTGCLLACGLNWTDVLADSAQLHHALAIAGRA
jgi:hypothetical protein